MISYYYAKGMADTASKIVGESVSTILMSFLPFLELQSCSLKMEIEHLQLMISPINFQENNQILRLTYRTSDFYYLEYELNISSITGIVEMSMSENRETFSTTIVKAEIFLEWLNIISNKTNLLELQSALDNLRKRGVPPKSNL